MTSKHINKTAVYQSVAKQYQSSGWLLVASIAALIIVGVFIYHNSNRILPILHVSVIGKFHHVDQQAFNAAVREFTQGSLLNIDVAGIQNISKDLPWIDKIQVTRVWPDRLRLIVSEKVAVARWGNHSLVNADGNVFTPDQTTLPAHLPVLDGPKGSYQSLTRHYLRISRILADEGITIRSLSMNKRHALQMILGNGIKVRFGRTDNDNEQRLRRFLMFYRSVIRMHQTQIAIIDMRYPNGVSVSWKQGKSPNFNGTV